MSVCMTPAGVKYVSMHDFYRSEASQYMTLARVKYVSMHD